MADTTMDADATGTTAAVGGFGSAPKEGGRRLLAGCLVIGPTLAAFGREIGNLQDKDKAS